jgi:tetratricopeptide (TPR) repeat protein
MSEATLAEIERGIEALEPVEQLNARLEAIPELADVPGEVGVRYRIARAIVQNRRGFYRAALPLLQEARSAAMRQGITGQLPRISRETSRIYSWRGEVTSAAMELLRCISEVEAAAGAAADAGDTAAGERFRADRAAALAEIGRLDNEAGRHEAALPALEEAARHAAILPPREAGRIALNHAEALFALGRHEDCLALIEASLPRFSDDYPRDLFNVRLIRARCLIALGREPEAEQVAREAREARPLPPGSYEEAEWQAFEGLLRRRDDPEAAIAALREAQLRFADDNLPRHEVEAGIALATLLADSGRVPEAEAVIADALKQARGLPALADRVRATAIGFWQKNKTDELTDDNIVAGDVGGRGGRFLVMATLGSGGFGTVQRAIDSETGEEVAIKRLNTGRAGAERAALEDSIRKEIAAAAKVPPRFAARTRYLHLDKDAQLILVQDFVEGPTLRKVLSEGSAALPLRLSIGAQLVRAVAALHQRGVAHRDLKPDNVILRNGIDPILIDLGLASLMGVSATFSGMGTPGYAPPEQWKTGTDPKFFGREDIYALGRMLAELGGEPPPDAGLKTRVLALLPGSRVFAGSYHGRLPTTISRMTEDNPARRTVDLGELAGMLDDAALAAQSAVSSSSP